MCENCDDPDLSKEMDAFTHEVATIAQENCVKDGLINNEEGLTLAGKRRIMKMFMKLDAEDKTTMAALVAGFTFMTHAASVAVDQAKTMMRLTKLVSGSKDEEESLFSKKKEKKEVWNGFLTDWLD